MNPNEQEGQVNASEPEVTASAEVEKLATNIAIKIAKELSAQKEKSLEASEKSAVLSSNVPSLTSQKVKLFTTKKGKSIEMEKSQVELCAKWFQAFLRRDHGKAMEYRSKLEPLNETTSAEGGYLVTPSVLFNGIVELVEDYAVFRPNATVIDMSSMSTNTLLVNSVASKPVASWGSENTPKATSSMTFGQTSLTPYLLAAIVPITNQLVEDAAVEVVRLVSKALAESIAKAEDKAFATGNGSGKPTGLNSYSYNGFDAGGSLTWDEINRLYFMLPQQYRSNGTWVMNGRTIAAVSGMVDSNNRPIFTESMLQPGVPYLKGRPVLEQNDLEASSIFFGDMSQYYIAHKGGLQLSVADQATVAGISLWERNLIAIRAEERIDGELTTTRAFVEMTNTGVS